MWVSIDGKPPKPFGAKELAKVSSKSPSARSVDGVVLDVDQASEEFLFAWRTLFGGIGFTGLMFIVIPLGGIAFSGHSVEPAKAVAILVPAIGIGVLLIFLHYRSAKRRWKAEVWSRAAAIASPGTRVRADAEGLSVGGEFATWSELTVERLDLNQFEGDEGASDYFRVERIGLVAGEKRFTLDRDLMSSGQRLVDAAFARLVAGRAR